LCLKYNFVPLLIWRKRKMWTSYKILTEMLITQQQNRLLKYFLTPINEVRELVSFLFRFFVYIF
jgi:hypothetical protein